MQRDALHDINWLTLRTRTKTALNEEFINRIEELIRSSKRILITGHHNPDGDAIGSVLAMHLFLKNRGIQSQCMVPGEFPDFLNWMPSIEKISIFSKENREDLISRADLIFCLDYNSLHRTGKMADPLIRSNAVKVLIDHHPEPNLSQFDLCYSETITSSTSELIFNFIEGLGGEKIIDKKIAECLYVGIMTDTGSFSYACNSSRTFRIVARLLETGLNAEYVHRQVYDNYSEARLRLLGFSLSEKLVVLRDLSSAYISLGMDELRKFDYKEGDTEGIVNYALSIDGIKVAVLMTERKNKIRLSFRSKGNFPVNEIARDHFEGGGHLNAAGGDSYLSMVETVSKLESILAHYKDRIEQSSYTVS